jgi:SAM-dependent methyltransferase
MDSCQSEFCFLTFYRFFCMIKSRLIFMRQRFRRLWFNWMYLGKKPPWDSGVSPPELLDFLKHNPAGRALDLGCGTGTNLLTLAQAGWQVTGIDFSAVAVRRAKKKLAMAGAAGEVRQGDVTRLEDVRGHYQLVLDIGCYHGVVQAGRSAYRRNLTEVLTSGGTFLLYAHLLPPENEASIGITEDDLKAFGAVLTLEDRQDSLDQWGRTATWLRYRV